MGADIGGGQEEPLEGQLGRLGVRRLDHTVGGVAAVQRQKQHRPGEHDLVAPVTNRDDRGVPIAGEKELGLVDIERVVRLDGDGLLLTAAGAVGEPGREL